MKKILFALILLLNTLIVFGTKISSPRGSGTATSSTDMSLEVLKPTMYSSISCNGGLTIENLYKDNGYVFYNAPNIPKSVISTLVLNKVYTVDILSDIITDSLAFTTNDNGATYDINLSNIQTDRFGRFKLTLKFESTSPNQYTNKPFYVFCSELLQFDCSRFGIAWKIENGIEVAKEVEHFKVLSQTGEVIAPETDEHIVNIGEREKDKYVVVEVLAPRELAGKYMVELESKDEDNFVYPNPTSHFIRLNEAAERCILRDEKGEVRGKYENVKEIDIREFGEGTYYLQIVTDDKLVKSHRILIKR